MAATRDHPALSEREKGMIRTLASAGWSCRAISRYVGRSVGIVSKVANEAGFDFAGRSMTATATEAHRRDCEWRRVLREEAAWKRVEMAMRAKPQIETVPAAEILAHTVQIGSLVDAAIRIGCR